MLPARQAIVDALATVPGLTPSVVMPDTPVAGAAWPVWSESAYRAGKLANPLGHTYDVRVILPDGATLDTVDAGDGLVEQVMSALSKVGTVETAGPVQIIFDPNALIMPGITARVTVTTC